MVFIPVLLLSCSNDEPSIEGLNIELRRPFLENKSYLEIKKEFNMLSNKEKHHLWNEKLEQILSQNIPEEQKELIQRLKLEFSKNYDNENNQIKQISLSLAKIIPEEEFKKMFFELDDYSPSSPKFLIHSQKQLIAELENSTFYYRGVNGDQEEDPDTGIGDVPDCNCNWSCDAQTINPGICSGSNCNPTNTGCGFLGMNGCYRILYFC